MSVKPVAWTPGPYHVFPNDGGYCANNLTAYRIETDMDRGSPRDICLALVVTDTAELGGEMGKANAELFAAAPELAEALRTYISHYPAFRSKPVGAPGSQAREKQEYEIALEDEAISLLARITPK